MFLIIYVIMLIVCTVLGAQLLIKKQGQGSLLPHLLAISTGFIISIAVFEFLPKVISSTQALHSSILLFLGLSSFFIFDKYITPHLKFFNSEPSCKKTGCGTHDPVEILSKKSSCHSISCLIVCSFFDGLQLGSAHLISSEIQIYLAIALFFHIVPSGALAASLSLSGQLGDKFAIKSSLLVALTLSLGLIISLFFANSLSFTLVIPFICGILIYNIFVHLLPAVTKKKKTLITLFTTIVLSAMLLHKH